MDHFSLIFRAVPAITTRVILTTIPVLSITSNSWPRSTPLDAYALGFCISNFHTGVSWNVQIIDHVPHFTCGLNRKTPSVGVITQLDILQSVVDFSDLKGHLHHVISLSLYCCKTKSVLLSELIPCLKKLNIDGHITDLYLQLSHSNVTTLSRLLKTDTNFSEF